MKGRVTILFGLILMLAGLVWHAASLRESTQAALAVQQVVPQLEMSQPEDAVAETQLPLNLQQNMMMTEKTVDGIGYIGILEIPALSLKLPVIHYWSSKNAKVAPCRYSGSVYQNDMILCAHNYDSHFGKLDQLTAGDAVMFADMDGNEFNYLVQESLIIEGTDVDIIQDGDWELTLFTCTPGGKMRYCVRCRLLPK